MGIGNSKPRAEFGPDEAVYVAANTNNGDANWINKTIENQKIKNVTDFRNFYINHFFCEPTLYTTSQKEAVLKREQEAAQKNPNMINENREIEFIRIQ